MNHLQYLDLLLEKSEQIIWTAPDLSEEFGEYFDNSYTKKYLKGKGLSFKTKDELAAFLKTGKLVPITRDELKTNFNNLTLRDRDFADEIKNPKYRASYESMKQELTHKGKITLPAPIIFDLDGLYYGFAGNRRMNLAFKYGLPLKVWMVRSPQ